MPPFINKGGLVHQVGPNKSGRWQKSSPISGGGVPVGGTKNAGHAYWSSTMTPDSRSSKMPIVGQRTAKTSSKLVSVHDIYKPSAKRQAPGRFRVQPEQTLYYGRNKVDNGTQTAQLGPSQGVAAGDDGLNQRPVGDDDIKDEDEPMPDLPFVDEETVIKSEPEIKMEPEDTMGQEILPGSSQNIVEPNPASYSGESQAVEEVISDPGLQLVIADKQPQVNVTVTVPDEISQALISLQNQVNVLPQQNAVVNQSILNTIESNQQVVLAGQAINRELQNQNISQIQYYNQQLINQQNQINNLQDFIIGQNNQMVFDRQQLTALYESFINLQENLYNNQSVVNNYYTAIQAGPNLNRQNLIEQNEEISSNYMIELPNSEAQTAPDGRLGFLLEYPIPPIQPTNLPPPNFSGLLNQMNVPDVGMGSEPNTINTQFNFNQTTSKKARAAPSDSRFGRKKRKTGEEAFAWINPFPNSTPPKDKKIPFNVGQIRGEVADALERQFAVIFSRPKKDPKGKGKARDDEEELEATKKKFLDELFVEAERRRENVNTTARRLLKLSRSKMKKK